MRFWYRYYRQRGYSRLGAWLRAREARRRHGLTRY